MCSVCACILLKLSLHRLHPPRRGKEMQSIPAELAIFRRIRMRPSEDDNVLETTPAKSNPVTVKVCRGINHFVTHICRNQSPFYLNGAALRCLHDILYQKSPRVSWHTAQHPITERASSAQIQTPGMCLISLSYTKSPCSRSVKADPLQRELPTQTCSD